jgi:CheY-like chemotaxis protein
MSAEQTQTAGRRILIVDDEASIRLICRINLTASGWACEEADNGEEAVVRIRADRPDVVLLDVMMPIRDGWMVAEDIAGDPRDLHKEYRRQRLMCIRARRGCARPLPRRCRPPRMPSRSRSG